MRAEYFAKEESWMLDGGCESQENECLGDRRVE